MVWSANLLRFDQRFSLPAARSHHAEPYPSKQQSTGRPIRNRIPSRNERFPDAVLAIDPPNAYSDSEALCMILIF